MTDIERLLEADLRSLIEAYERLRERLNLGNMVPAAAVIQIDPAEVARQREAGWTFHPELFCHKCGRRNAHSWFAPSEIWNRAVEGTERGILDILCPACFIEQYEAAYDQRVTWEIRPEHI